VNDVEIPPYEKGRCRRETQHAGKRIVPYGGDVMESDLAGVPGVETVGKNMHLVKFGGSRRDFGRVA
jgi:hypothetical protein